MKNGETVAAFEREFAAYVGAKYAIALCNGTATLHTALAAMGVKHGDRVAAPPLTMSATTVAVLHAGAIPRFVDVDERTWLMPVAGPQETVTQLPVSLYGLNHPSCGLADIDDAAQTLRKHSAAAFTSYSFQASKILALGEGGMLATNHEFLAVAAREFSSLGYRMRADQPRIDPAAIKAPTFERHHALGWNYRMNDLTAHAGFLALRTASRLLADRAACAAMYREVIAGCSWIVPQHVPDGWRHDYWTYAVACDTPDRALRLVDAIVQHGGERPYAAWQLTYHEPAFAHFGMMISTTDNPTPRPSMCGGLCPNAEYLQPRLLQFQTNDLASAERNATALRAAIGQLSAARSERATERHVFGGPER